MVGLMSMGGNARPADSRLEGYIRRIAGGDTQALRALYEETAGAVQGYALSILRHPQDAEDVLQDTFIRVSASAAGYTAHGKPMAWLLTIARNLSLMKLREGARALPVTDEEWERALPPESGASPEDRLVLAAALDALAEEERQIVMLHAVAGLRHREIASLLQLPLSTVLSKYHRALRKLKERLTKEAE